MVASPKMFHVNSSVNSLYSSWDKLLIKWHSSFWSSSSVRFRWWRSSMESLTLYSWTNSELVTLWYLLLVPLWSMSWQRAETRRDIACNDLQRFNISPALVFLQTIVYITSDIPYRWARSSWPSRTRNGWPYTRAASCDTAKVYSFF